MQGAPAGSAAGALLAAACLALAACGLGVAGLSAAADGGSGAQADATTDAGSPGHDAQSAGEAQGAGDGSGGSPDVQGGADAPGAVDAPGASDVQAQDTSVVDAAGEDVADVAAEAPPPQCPPCGVGRCCSGGVCVALGPTACGDPDQTCVDCTGAAAGTQCVVLDLHSVCGCAGPASEAQCPAGHACYNQQCDTACDGQHPCSGGCCSGNDLATSTCVGACPAKQQCMGNYCQGGP